jgi:type II secretory pathway pseudopilin PulG
MIAVTIVTTSLVGLFSALIQISRLNASNREILAAMRAAEQMIETLKTSDFEKIFASYNPTSADDPLPGPGTGPGPHFDVPDLSPQPDDPDHKCGRILFPTDSSGNQLREDVKDPDLGMPRDLDGNGTIDASDVAATYKILPVTIRIDWQGIQGKRTWSYRTVLIRTRKP